MPIFLWSVVVSQASQPRGGASRPWRITSGRAARLTSVALLASTAAVLARLALLALVRQLLAGRLDVVARPLGPSLELVRRDRAHPGAHVGVAGAAELRALAVVDALPAGRDLEPGLVHVPGDAVCLAAELRDPPRVDHVRGGDLEHHGRFGRHHHLVVRIELGAARVVVAPEVLLAVHLDRQNRAAGRG